MDYKNSIRKVFFFICCKYGGNDNGALLLGQIAVVANKRLFHTEKERD
jgi:hypothetical protein